MIRIIVEGCFRYGGGLDRREYTTIDVHIPELESMLKRGGHGEDIFESWRLIGAEIIPDTKKE